MLGIQAARSKRAIGLVYSLVCVDWGVHGGGERQGSSEDLTSHIDLRVVGLTGRHCIAMDLGKETGGYHLVGHDVERGVIDVYRAF